MHFFVYLWVFVVGACIGSFINVVIYRLQDFESSFFKTRSYCYHCHKNLRFRDMIPILSWIFLKGRCHYCKSRIAFRYVFVEALMGLLALCCWIWAANSSQALEIYILFGFLISIGFIDLDSWMIPLPLPIASALIGLGFGYGNSLFVFYNRLFGLIIGFGFFALFLIISSWILRKTGRLKQGENSMGWGDPILLGAIGANLGWMWLSPLILLSTLQAIVLYGFFNWTRKPLADDDWIPPPRSMPFGPFLSLGGIEIALWILIS